MKLLIVAALLGVAAPLSAQQVYKCVVNKATVYQSLPCENGAAVKTWDAKPDPAPSNAELWRRHRLEREMAARNARSRVSTSSRGSSAFIPTNMPNSGSACEAAKARRKATLDAVGIRRTHDLLRSLDNQVNAACK